MNLYPLLESQAGETGLHLSALRLCLGPHFLVPVFLDLTKAAHLRLSLVLLPGNLPRLLFSVLRNGKG